RLYLLFALVPLIGMFVLVGPSLERHPITQRARFMFVDETSELDLSEEALQATLKTHVNRFLPPTHPTFHRVLNVSENFVRVIGPVRDWELFVVDDPFTVNAFVLPAGKIFVFTGLINRVPSDEHLAAIIGHEISHVLSRHSAETVGATLLFNVFFDFIHAILYSMSVNLPMISDLAGRSVNATSQLISNLPYSRMCEAEADAIGIYLMALAGYNPEKAVEVWDMFHNIQ
ncbi:peptidase family M48-domain-containing protein, partial [Cladochytrium replicatum]